MSYIRRISGTYRRNKATVQVKHAKYVKNRNIEDKKQDLEGGQQTPTPEGD